MNVLLTGGTGYIASHTALVLVEAGHRVVLLDNLFNSTVDVVDRLQSICGQGIPFIKADIRDRDAVESVLRDFDIQAVFHFAGLKAVGESVAKPLDYFDNNVGGTVSLLQAMRSAGVFTLVFSSSATVYGEPRYLPLDEQHPTAAVNPYGRTKLHIEEILRDLASSDPAWHVCSLRYFNPVGAHDSGRIGENPNGIPNNLMPFIARVAAGVLPQLNVFGDDYPTVDGTGVRDYIHVMDLADGHLAAFRDLCHSGHRSGYEAINLGTGRGYSVLEMVRTFEAVTGRPVPYRVAPRRAGDAAACYADPARAAEKLGWRTRRDLAEMCESAWRFQRDMVT